MADLLTREAILGALDLETIEIEVPEWEGSILIGGLSLAERTDLLSRMRDEDGEISTEKASLVTFVAGVRQPKFSEADYDALRKKNAGVIDRIVMEITRLSGLNVHRAQARRLF